MDLLDGRLNRARGAFEVDTALRSDGALLHLALLLDADLDARALLEPLDHVAVLANHEARQRVRHLDHALRAWQRRARRLRRSRGTCCRTRRRALLFLACAVLLAILASALAATPALRSRLPVSAFRHAIRRVFSIVSVVSAVAAHLVAVVTVVSIEVFRGSLLRRGILRDLCADLGCASLGVRLWG